MLKVAGPLETEALISHLVVLAARSRQRQSPVTSFHAGTGPPIGEDNIEGNGDAYSASDFQDRKKTNLFTATFMKHSSPEITQRASAPADCLPSRHSAFPRTASLSCPSSPSRPRVAPRARPPSHW